MCGQQRTKHTHTHTKQLHEPHQTPTATPKVHEQILVLVPEKPRVPAAVAYAFCLTSTSMVSLVVGVSRGTGLTGFISTACRRALTSEASTAPLSAVAMIFLSALNASGYVLGRGGLEGHRLDRLHLDGLQKGLDLPGRR